MTRNQHSLWENECWNDFNLGQNRPIYKGPPQTNTQAAAVLISGPPGIGKTSTARVVGKTLGYELIEMNASDTRSKKVILEKFKPANLSMGVSSKGGIVKRLLIMDEVDGMSANDRGGVGGICELIKTTQIPIICICNDRQKMKTLANYCYDLKFNKPNKVQVRKRLLEILTMENFEIELNALDFLIESSGNDIRTCMNSLEMQARIQGTMSYLEAKNQIKSFEKDSTLNIYDAASKLLSQSRELNLREKLDLFFIDYQTVPLLVHQNYLDAMGTGNSNTIKTMGAADSIAVSDMISKKIRVDGEWALLPSFGYSSSVAPGFWSGSRVAFVKFPEILGKMSGLNKKQKLLLEVKAAVEKKVSGNKESILNDFVPVFFEKVVKLLRNEEVEEAAILLNEYCLNPNMIKEHLVELQFNSVEAEKIFKAIPATTKKSLTKIFNSIFSSSLIKQKKKKKERKLKEKFDPDFEEKAESSESEDEEKFIAQPKIRTKKK